MSSRNEILDKIKKHTNTHVEMPDLDRVVGIKYPDKIAKFIELSKFVGGDAILVEEGKDINEIIKALHPDAKVIASNLPGITLATVNPDEVADAHSLNGTDLAIIQGELGVAENGSVWIPQNVKEKVVYFIAEYLIIILDKKNIVDNMHEAYDNIKFNDYGFGIFISGPSKTADIEQSLVIGAHGAKGVTVLLK